MVVGILAVLKAGGAYVPLDGGIITDSTLQHVISDSGALLVLTLRAYEHRVAEISKLVLEDVIAADECSNAPSTKAEDLSSPSDSCYIIYTSGF
jgi:non-ribosomal peptide synthetase component F